uniref:Uncharacterized protein n=1 Tax=Magallana gigas TaxID=29159 RepID=K1QR47_MAGGI
MAEKCASQLQELYDSELLSSISSPDQVITESKKDLCLSTISGNSITQCYTTNSKSCVDQDHLAIQWNETMKDATNLCNETSVSSAPECVDEEVLKLSTENQPSTEMCLRLLSLTACLYEKETTRYEDIRAMHSIVGDKVNKILSSGVLRNCTFNVRRDIILIQDLRNSSCAQTQEDSYEDEDLPICSGHNYGLIKCKRNVTIVLCE